jgi:signal transduction histidine kinase
LRLPASIVFRSTESQMMAILAASLAVLFATMIVLELVEHDTPIETAAGTHALVRLERLVPVLQRVGDQNVDSVVGLTSSCHAGYSVTDQPFHTKARTAETRRLEAMLARELSLDATRLQAGHAHLTRDDFSYRRCGSWEIVLPMEGIVISLQLPSGRWLNTEVHSHEWHFQQKLDWMLKVTAAFAFVGGVALFFIRRSSKPLHQLTAAARSFADGMETTDVVEDGPVDLRRAIRSFNAMQREVAGEMARRTGTLAAISHDIRTPLTALRVKAEMVDDPDVRDGLIASIARMERVTASALEYLKGESRGEPMRQVDLSALLESECAEFEELGHDVIFLGEPGVRRTCRPEAIVRAVRNLIDNAIKYGGNARISLLTAADSFDIVVADDGPGIPEDKLGIAMQPFQRLSNSRGGNGSGFGLGLAIARAIAEGHEGQLILGKNRPSGLAATIRLPSCTDIPATRRHR